MSETTADDLSVLDVSEATSVMEVKDNSGRVLVHPDGRPFTITLYSKDSQRFLDLSRKQADRRISSGFRQPVPFAVMEKNAVELLAAVTKSWDILLGGVAPPNTKEAYADAYTRLPALREQVDQHLDARANFSKTS